MKRIVIVGATSGIGWEVARLYAQQGWRVGIAGRRTERLEELRATAPSQFEVQQIDVTSDEGPANLLQLIQKLGGMDVFFLSSGIGNQNPSLDVETELRTVETNTAGFTRMVLAAYHYFEQQKQGHIAVISSIAGTKGLGIAPSYSATKRYQNTYIESLAQLSRMRKLSIRFTDIRPGFVRTDLLSDGNNYPLLMSPQKVARKIVKAIHRKKSYITIDWKYRLLVFFWRMIPRWLWVRLAIQTPSH